MKKYFIVVVVILFLILSAVFYSMKTWAPEYRFGVLMAGNVIMAILTVVSYALVKAQVNKRGEAFVRGVYSSSFLKLFVCIGAVLAYALINKPNVHKPTLFVLFGIYAVYSVIETLLMSKMARTAK
jgi:hypothetical protein